MGEAANDTVRLLWGPPAKPTRGPKPALSLERIAAAGVEAADAEGLGAVSMQKVAGLLDFTKMSLYRYVPGKAELIALMVESALDEPPATAEGDWREQLTAWAHHLAASFARHPWLLDATIGPRVLGPRELAWLERVVAALDGRGLTGSERMDAAVLLAGHVRSIAEQSRAVGPDGSPEAELLTALGTVVHRHADRYPALAAAMAEPDGRDQALDFGLERILDGLAALIDRRTTPTPPR
ncbi:TetR/AcrR family transcriptional regulator [Streptomyces sp. FH025]|uniref:TetR/AcrR family transcriptional regulator n=1 Tax=Streptomyces sp. FH025 TaxID=2815937 RepID=UPI001A9CC9E4|nr:TetR/AcrR family transcriptional regulator C-terminal domain-containing protein [Streptomyces sp. FH025]MBO1417872.1 TetR/AcrR family transcriptional regulator C-terminal domain-containing protein [Streptomyces sp. FH025]